MRPTVLLLALVLSFAGCAEAPAPKIDGGTEAPAGEAWFEEVGRERGIDFAHASGHSGPYLFPEIIAGGAALFDMDGDDDLDAYLVQSGSLEGQGDPAAVNRLFRNRGDGTFDDVTEGSGTADRGYGIGVAAGDYDNDGDTDLYVTNFGPNVLLRNDGDGRFTDVSAAVGVAHPGWGTSAAFLDYDVDGDLDLFVANYVNWSIQNEQDCYNPAGALDYCLPTNYNTPATDVLYRNDGPERFTDVSVEAGLQLAFGNGLGVVAADFDGNGLPDLFVANDTMLNQLWLNQGDGTFAEESLLRGCALDEHGKAKAGMGVGVGDFDFDGDPDLLVVNIEEQTDSFFQNKDGFFSDITGRAGLGSVSRKFTRFGAGLVDFDNDGVYDLYQANGKVSRAIEPERQDLYAEINVVFRGGVDGRFSEVLPRGGTPTPLVETSRAAAFGDVDNDGGIDILLFNKDGPARLLRNVVPDRGNWIGFRVLEQNGRDALGATVTVRVGDRELTRDVRAAYSYCASNDPRVHVGLGAATSVDDVSVLWPGGRRESYGAFDAGQRITLRHGAGS